MLNHLGLFLAMTTATLGNADMQRLKMITLKGEPEWRALSMKQQVVELPLTIEPMTVRLSAMPQKLRFRRRQAKTSMLLLM